MGRILKEKNPGATIKTEKPGNAQNAYISKFMQLCELFGNNRA